MFKQWIIKIVIRWLRELDDADLKRKILTEAVKHLYNAIGPDDILQQNSNGNWMFRGKPMTNTEADQLKEEAAFLRSMKLWTIIKYDIRYQLGKKMWEEAKVKDDLVWGQLTTFLWDIINTRINKM